MQEQGQDIPALASRPLLEPFEQPYYDAFQMLSSSRQVTTGGYGPIPLSEIAAYFQIYNILEDERAFYIDVIHQLDDVYLTYHYKKG